MSFESPGLMLLENQSPIHTMYFAKQRTESITILISFSFTTLLFSCFSHNTTLFCRSTVVCVCVCVCVWSSKVKIFYKFSQMYPKDSKDPKDLKESIQKDERLVPKITSSLSARTALLVIEKFCWTA